VNFSTACSSGCSLCNGTRNSDCFACEDTTLYRDTTNIQVFSGVCVTRCGSSMKANEDVFGVRTCTKRELDSEISNKDKCLL